MDKKVLLEILNTRYIEFTREEIKDIMNEELDKDPDEMDLELVDLCLDALEGKFDYLKDEQTKKNESPETNLGKENPIELKRRISFKRIIIAAAIVALIACVSIGVYADQRNNNVPEDVVGYGDGYYEVNLNGTTTTKPDDSVSRNELTETLKENGIENPVLPQIFFEDGCEISELLVRTLETGEKVVSFNVNIIEVDAMFSVSIAKYADSTEISDKDAMVSKQFRNIKHYTVNDISILLFCNPNNQLIVYCKDSEKYQVSLDDCTIEYAEAVINSIG